MGKNVKRTGLTVILFCLLLPAMAQAATTARIKDIVSFEGVRDNILIGYGLVVGLKGTGDKLTNNEFTNQSLIAFLERQGINTRGTPLKSKNVAAVTITATLPPFSRSGSKIDVTVSAMGDAISLQGGTLVATPLYGADGEVYAVAQGAITIGGFQATGATGTSILKGVPTSGFVTSGGIVEREIDFQMNHMRAINLALKNPDISTAKRVATVINDHLGVQAAVMEDPGTVKLQVPENYKDKVGLLLADVEPLRVETDQPAKIIIDEASGTIVMGENVRISKVAVAQGNLVLRINETPQVIQPGPLAPEGAQTAVVQQSSVSVEEGQGKLAALETGTTLRDLVAGLNALGVGPRDLIAILQNIKAAGALQAEIESK
jgi:flagellar P-ring protein precursor FlgI